MLLNFLQVLAGAGVQGSDPPKNALQVADIPAPPALPCTLRDPSGGGGCSAAGYGAAWRAQDGAGSIDYTPRDVDPITIDQIHPRQPVQPDATPFNLRTGLIPDPAWDPSTIIVR